VKALIDGAMRAMVRPASGELCQQACRPDRDGGLCSEELRATVVETAKVVTDMASAPGTLVKDARPKAEKASKLEYKRVNEVHVLLSPQVHAISSIEKQ